MSWSLSWYVERRFRIGVRTFCLGTTHTTTRQHSVRQSIEGGETDRTAAESDPIGVIPLGVGRPGVLPPCDERPVCGVYPIPAGFGVLEE